jgi:hypothetical protein
MKFSCLTHYCPSHFNFITRFSYKCNSVCGDININSLVENEKETYILYWPPIT